MKTLPGTNIDLCSCAIRQDEQSRTMTTTKTKATARRKIQLSPNGSHPTKAKTVAKAVSTKGGGDDQRSNHHKRDSKSDHYKSGTTNKSRISKGATSSSSSPYHAVADLLNAVWSSASSSSNGSTKSLKSLVYHKTDGSLLCSKRTYAVTTKVLQNKALLDAVIASSSSLTDECQNTGLLYVLVYELLLSPQQTIVGGGAIKRLILHHHEALKSALQRIQKQQSKNKTNNNNTKSSNNASNEQPLSFPRYVRVNTCRTTGAELLRQLQKSETPATDTATATSVAIPMATDPDVPNLLVVPPSFTGPLLSRLEQVSARRHVVMQDKSSCFPAMCLMDGMRRNEIALDSSTSSTSKNKKKAKGRGVTTTSTVQGDILDACAAPGNKTSHLAALLGEMTSSSAAATKRTVFALDRDNRRCKLLQSRMSDLVPTLPDAAASTDVSVVVQHCDFLSTQPCDYPTVTAILLDPSCSGSGIYGRTETTTSTNNTKDKTQDDDEHPQHNEQQQDRLTKLSGFQITALRHAMSFPTVASIVYSTCSVHYAENEGVVAEALHDHRNEWEIVAPSCLSHWTRRGQLATGRNDEDLPYLSKEESKCLIRANEKDQTNGFFVACLCRKSIESGETPQKETSAISLPFDNPKFNLDLGIPIYDDEILRQWKTASYFSKTCPETRDVSNLSKDNTVEEKSSGEVSDRRKMETHDKKAVTTRTGKRNMALEAWKPEESNKKKQRLNESKASLVDEVSRPADSDNTPNASKKRDKALEWKRRQRDAKMSRVKKS